ncbi:unnamed protein product [Rotaria sp. Silwood2]|nr:unnamed protein product [Rotaria sp. Silwood2]CAF4491543.1 unnamed protein product [Rotaria sp. Silwood2]
MASATPKRSKSSLKHIEWMWQSNPNPCSESEPVEWSYYSDIENLIIEDAFSNQQPQVVLDDCYIDFKDNFQISNVADNKKRLVKRVVGRRRGKNLREARFMDIPVTSGRPFNGAYGWMSPFIVDIRRDLTIQKDDELPSKKPDIIPMLVEKAVCGIIEEGTHLGKQKEAEYLANMLGEQKNKGMKEVWKCCAYLYSLESFLYKTLNAAMRLVGDKEQEQVWRSKVRTLGPFCLLLWDDPFNKKLKIDKTLYRGAELKPEQIANFKDMARHPEEYRSFQAFTSCSRSRQKAEAFGNTLFIMEVLFAFTADLSGVSEYPDEEEELITPGVCFRVRSVKIDHTTKKHLIYLQLRQRFSGK